MDFEKIRAQWNDPEFNKAFDELDKEPVSAIIERMKRRDRRDARRSRLCRILMTAPLAVLLGWAAVQLFIRENRVLPLQTAAFILGFVVVIALQWLDKEREKSKSPKLWLSHKEFLRDEYHRIGRNIWIARWNFALVSVAIVCLALYAAPMVSAGYRIACWVMTGAAVFALLVYNGRKISGLEWEKGYVAGELEALEALSCEPCLFG